MSSANGTDTTPDSPPGRPRRVRRVVSMVLVVFAAIVIPIAVTAVWAVRTVLNTDRFAETTLDVTSDPVVINVVAAQLTDQVAQAVTGPAVLAQLPPALQPAVPIIVGAVRNRVESRVEELLSSDIGQTLLERTVRQAHASAMRILSGDGLLSSEAFTVENGTVTLDLRPLIHEVLVGLQVDGVIPASVTIPAPGDPPGALATRFGVTLPDNFGQIVVYQTEDASNQNVLDVAQRALVVGKRGVVLLFVLGLVLAAVAIIVAVDRRRATFRVGLGVVLVTVILIVAVRRVSAAVPDALSTPGAKAVASALADSLRSSLVRVLVVLAVLGAVVAAVARWWDLLLAQAAAHAEAARFGAGALGLLLLLVLGLSWGSLIFAVVVAGLGFALVAYATHRATPAVTPEQPAPLTN